MSCSKAPPCDKSSDENRKGSKSKPADHKDVNTVSERMKVGGHMDHEAEKASLTEDMVNEDIFDPTLFIDRSYTSEEITVNGVGVNISALHTSSSTDFDMTGQIIWPASKLLALYLTVHPALVRGRSVLELGAGVGLAGMVAAKLTSHPHRVTLTDNQPEVLRVLQDNIAQNFNHLKEEERPRCISLSWGEKLEEFQEQFGCYDVILGADVIFWPLACPLLFKTVAHLLKSVRSEFIVSYVTRSDFSTKLMYDSARQSGLSWVEEKLSTQSCYHDLIMSQAECGRTVHLLRFTKR